MQNDTQKQQEFDQIAALATGSQDIVAEKVLNPLCDVAFKAVDPIRPVPGSRFHRLVEFVRNGLPTDDDNITDGVQVVTLVVKFFGPLSHWNPVTRLMSGKVPTDDWRKNHDHDSHHVIRFHGLTVPGSVLCLRSFEGRRGAIVRAAPW